MKNNIYVFLTGENKWAGLIWGPPPSKIGTITRKLRIELRIGLNRHDAALGLQPAA